MPDAPTFKRQSLLELINPHPKQREFMEAVRDRDYVLYGGAAGGGKSYIMRWTLVRLLLGWAQPAPAGPGVRGVRVGLFCEDYPSLEDRQLSKVKFEFPAWLGRLNESKHEFSLAPQFGGGVICFRNLDDVSKYQSAEFAAIAVDELTRNEQATFDYLRFRLRWPGIERPKFLAATNPGGIGHAWVKKLWLDRDFPPELEATAPQFALVKARAADNPHLPASYYATLQSLPPDMRRAYAEGDWDFFAGQMFSEFRQDIHVIDPFEIPAWWRRWGSNDPGWSDPAAWHWFAADEDGTVYVYREATFKGITHSDQAKEVKRLTGSEDIERWVTGMDAFNPHPSTGKSYVDYYAEAGMYGFRRPIHGPQSRQTRAATMHEYLKPVVGPDGKPLVGPDGKTRSKLRIFSSCARLVQTLPTLMRDDPKVEQVKESDSDHWYDSCTYGLAMWHADRSKPLEATYPAGTYGQMSGMADVFGGKVKRKSVFDRDGAM